MRFEEDVDGQASTCRRDASLKDREKSVEDSGFDEDMRDDDVRGREKLRGAGVELKLPFCFF